MSAVPYLLTFPWVQPLGWTLLHFVWQGVLLGLLASVVLALARRGSPQTRYLIACGFLALCVTTPLLTFILLARPPFLFAPPPHIIENAPEHLAIPSHLEAPEVATSPNPAPVATANAASPQVQLERPSQPVATASSIFCEWINESTRWIVPLWLLGVTLMALRLGLGWGRIQVWRYTASHLTDARLLARFAELSAQMNLTDRVRLLVSDRIAGPMTLGWIKPVILVPTQILTGLSAPQLEAILLHELAHVARYDYLVNLLQSVVEVVLFYHPAVWWLGRQIRDIREECCDETALRLGANRLVYAKALAGLAELHLDGPALAATGGSLFNRIARLLGRPPERSPWNRSHAAWGLALLAVLTASLALLYSPRLMAETDPAMANTKAPPVGIVTDASGAPVPGAEVLLYSKKSEYGTKNRVVEKVTTDTKGRFAFTQPLPFKAPHGTDRFDHYILAATHEGLAPAWAVIVGGTPEQKEFTLQLTKPNTQTFEVVDLQGRPVEGATVWLTYAGVQEEKEPFLHESMELPEDLGICHGVTDATGKTTITNLPDTSRSLVASKPGFADESGCGTPSTGIPRFTLKPGATLEGRVIDPLGLPVEGATVWLYPKFGWHLYFMGQTDHEGRYSIPKIWSTGTQKDWGKYEVGIRDDRFTAIIRTVAFTSGQTITGFDLAAVPGTKILGTLLDPVTQEPIAGGEVYVDSESGRQGVVTDIAGKFDARVMEGKARIFFGGPPGGTYVDEEARPGSFRSSLDTRVSGAEFPVTIYSPSGLGKLGLVRGKVVDGAGKPAAFSSVAVALTEKPDTRLSTTGWSGNIFRGATSAADGTFSRTLPVGFGLTFIASSLDGEKCGLLSAKSTSDPYDCPSPVVLQATVTADLLLLDLAGKPRPNLEVQINPQAFGVDLWLNQSTEKTDAKGILHLKHLNPDLSYKVATGDFQTTWSLFLPTVPAAAQPVPLLITDRYLLRAIDADGQPVAIKKIKEFTVWILYQGSRSRWTDEAPTKLEKLGADIVLLRKTIVLAKPGDKMELLLEAESGALVRASGTIPDDVSGVLLVRATAVTKGDYTLDPSLRPAVPNEVLGRVVDPAGKPVAGATVTFNNVFWPADPTKTFGNELTNPVFTTDAQGLFRVLKTPNRFFSYVTLFKPGFGPVFLANVPIGKGFVVKLQKTTRLKGTIGGEKPGKVGLLFEKSKDSDQTEGVAFHETQDIQYRTETDANGAYDFPMEAGTYRYRATSTDGRFALGEVIVDPNRTVALPAVLRSGCPVTMRVTDAQTGKPVKDFHMSIYEQRANAVYAKKMGSGRQTDAKGEAHWENLLPGKTQFAPRDDPNYLDAGYFGVYNRWWWANQTDAWMKIDYAKARPTGSEGVTDIVVDVADGMPVIDVQVERGVRISGTVTGPDGVPCKSINIGIVPTDGQSESLSGDSRFNYITDEKGAFSGYIPAGNGVMYNLSAAYPVEVWTAKGLNNDLAPLANAVSEPFNSKPGDDLTFHLVMKKGGWITGKLVDAQGQPATTWKVTGTHADRMDLCYGKRVVTADKQGNFRLGPLRPGHYTVQCGQGDGLPLSVHHDPAHEKEATVAEGQTHDVGALIVPEG